MLSPGKATWWGFYPATDERSFICFEPGSEGSLLGPWLAWTWMSLTSPSGHDGAEYLHTSAGKRGLAHGSQRPGDLKQSRKPGDSHSEGFGCPKDGDYRPDGIAARIA
jgi:hypothetical protein